LVLCWGQGHSLHRVAQVFGCKWETVQAAVRRFHQGGVPALADAQHPGRPRQVSKKARQALFAAMHATPQAAGLTGFRWTAQRVQQYLRRAHQHQVSRTTAWREIRRCGRSRKRGQYYLSSPDPLYAEKKGR
jgi:transposase